MNRLPVLNYHVVQVREGEYGGNAGERAYFILKKKFRTHMEFLKKEKFSALKLVDLSNWSSANPVALKKTLLTFDDGHLSHYEHVMPLLSELEMSAVFFIPVGLVGGTGYMDWRQIQELASNGFDIGSHSLNHIPLTQLDGARLRAELTDSKKALEDRLGKAVESFSVPRGFYNARVQGAAREAGYGYVFTSRFGLNLPKTDSLALLRMAVKVGTRDEEFMNWMNGDTGLKECVEGIKDTVRGFVPPALYDFAASLKR